MDKFPEAFSRMERQVNIDDIKSFHELKLQFESWAGFRWKGSQLQIRALKNEAKKLDLLTRETITRGKKQVIIYRSIRTGRFVSHRNKR